MGRHMIMRDRRQFNVAIDTPDFRRYVEAAAKRGMSFTEYIRAALEVYYQMHEDILMPDQPATPPLRLAMDADDPRNERLLPKDVAEVILKEDPQLTDPTVSSDIRKLLG